VEPIKDDVLWFLRRGPERRACEVRLAPDGPGYELVVTDSDHSHVERFATVAALLTREHELLAAWRAQGWELDGGASSQRRRG
jgi:hypothetical protein